MNLKKGNLRLRSFYDVADVEKNKIKKAMKVTYRVLVATDELYSAYTSPLFRIDDYNRPARNDSRHNQGAYFSFVWNQGASARADRIYDDLRACLYWAKVDNKLPVLSLSFFLLYFVNTIRVRVFSFFFFFFFST